MEKKTIHSFIHSFIESYCDWEIQLLVVLTFLVSMYYR